MNASPNEDQSAPAADTATTPETAPAKQRSTAEKVIVRVLILLLVVFAAVEARARFGYEQTLSAISDLFEGDKAGEEADKETRLSDAESLFKLFPSRTTETRDGAKFVKLSWFSFVYPSRYEIELAVTNQEDPSEQMVLSFMTPDAKVDKKIVANPKDDGNDPDPAGLGDDGGPPPPTAFQVPGGPGANKKRKKRRRPKAEGEGEPTPLGTKTKAKPEGKTEAKTESKKTPEAKTESKKTPEAKTEEKKTPEAKTKAKKTE